ncbi:hypothetical protein BCU36_011775 [Vibrio lentus]|uniref:hypothetical protein n=1 Tax=Vibrio lentus TaxID=136468 RepID=UPI0018E4AE73|nr:hypothetical protein [Vibrio lentus]
MATLLQLGTAAQLVKGANSDRQDYYQAQLTNPERWSRQTRDWNCIDDVFLNPEKKAV